MPPVKVEGIDERVFVTEGDAEAHYVAFFERPCAVTADGTPVSFSQDGYRVSGGSVAQVLLWAAENAPAGALWSVGLIQREPGGELGLIWLEGGDRNDDRLMS
jgi:hypothetical protein